MTHCWASCSAATGCALPQPGAGPAMKSDIPRDNRVSMFMIEKV